MTMLTIAGECISAGEAVCSGDGATVYRASGLRGPTVSVIVGTALEDIREGFRVQISDAGEVREDDA